MRLLLGIESLTRGIAANIGFLPQFQANPCCTLATAIAKTCHWLRQGHIEANAPLGVMYWRPCTASARSGLKVPSGKGGTGALAQLCLCGILVLWSGHWWRRGRLAAHGCRGGLVVFIRPGRERQAIGQRISGRLLLGHGPWGRPQASCISDSIVTCAGRASIVHPRPQRC